MVSRYKEARFIAEQRTIQATQRRQLFRRIQGGLASAIAIATFAAHGAEAKNVIERRFLLRREQVQARQEEGDGMPQMLDGPPREYDAEPIGFNRKKRRGVREALRGFYGRLIGPSEIETTCRPNVDTRCLQIEDKLGRGFQPEYDDGCMRIVGVGSDASVLFEDAPEIFPEPPALCETGLRLQTRDLFESEWHIDIGRQDSSIAFGLADALRTFIPRASFDCVPIGRMNGIEFLAAAVFLIGLSLNDRLRKLIPSTRDAKSEEEAKRILLEASMKQPGLAIDELRGAYLRVKESDLEVSGWVHRAMVDIHLKTMTQFIGPDGTAIDFYVDKPWGYEVINLEEDRTHGVRATELHFKPATEITTQKVQVRIEGGETKVYEVQELAELTRNIARNDYGGFIYLPGTSMHFHGQKKATLMAKKGTVYVIVNEPGKKTAVYALTETEQDPNANVLSMKIDAPTVSALAIEPGTIHQALNPTSEEAVFWEHEFAAGDHIPLRDDICRIADAPTIETNGGETIATFREPDVGYKRK